MVQRRTNKGQIIDFDALRSTQEAARPAVGNMGTDGKGNLLGKGGKVVQSKEDRVRSYYNDLDEKSINQKSLKGDLPSVEGDTKPPMPDVATAKTQAENVRTAPQPDPVIEEPVAPEGEEFDTEEPLGFKEVELPNGDIEMVPYYREEDAE